MNQPTVARDMMRRNLVTLNPEMDVLAAIDVLLKFRISGAPVVDTWGRFLGIFSEKSSLQFVISAAYDELPSANLMPFVDRDPPTITEDTDCLTIAQTFLDASCRRLPVLDHEGRLLGQISRRDLLRATRETMKARADDSRVTATSLYISAIFEGGERPI
jgi:CBS domain-containing protein